MPSTTSDEFPSSFLLHTDDDLILLMFDFLPVIVPSVCRDILQGSTDDLEDCSELLIDGSGKPG